MLKLNIIDTYVPPNNKQLPKLPSEMVKYLNETKSRILCGDSTTLLDHHQPGSVQLIVTSPPYNIGKEYESKKDLTNYLQQMQIIINKLYIILKPGGSICWQVGNYIDNGEIVPLDVLFYPIFKSTGLKLRNRIIWHYGHGVHCTNRLSPRYETILWFTKGDSYIFNLDNIRVPSKYPNKKHYKGPKKGQLSGNPLGKNPSDIWETLMHDFESCIWEIPNVKSAHCEKTDHPCQFPIELAERCILAFSNQGDIVIDPFCGSGSTIVAAEKNGRVGIGYDIVEQYCQIAINRLTELKNGNLSYRPLGKHIEKY